MPPFTIGVTGGSGSGKSYLLGCLLQKFRPEEVCLIAQDHYYKPRELQSTDENGVQNFDLPEAIDWKSFLNDVRTIKAGTRVEKTEYTYNNPSAKPGIIVFNPAPILIIEGLFIMHDPELRKELDFTIFIEAKDHLKLTRRIFRDNKERGYDIQDVLYRYEHHVVPAYEKLIRPLRDMVDVIIPNNSQTSQGIELVAMGIRARLAGLANSP